MAPVRSWNDEEWHNPDNWSGWGPFCIYFSKRDTRLMVPQYWNSRLSPHIPNFGHRFAGLYLAATGLIAVIMLITILRMRSDVDRRPNAKPPAAVQER